MELIKLSDVKWNLKIVNVKVDKLLYQVDIANVIMTKSVDDA